MMGPRHTHTPGHAFGFTLVEMLVTIVIAAIVAGFIGMLLNAPMESYFSQTRRSALVDSANRIAHAVTSDVRTALPNSLRATNNASGVYALELLATDPAHPMARYYGPGDDTPSVAGRVPLQFASTSSFSTLDMFNMSETAAYSSPDLLSIGNLGAAASNAYIAATGVMTASGTIITITPQSPPGAAPPGTLTEDLVSVPAPVTFVWNGQIDRNAYLVTGPVSYVCDPASSGDANAGTVKKYTGYGVTAAQLVPPPGTTVALIAQNVASCSIYTEFAKDTGYNFGQIAVLSVSLSLDGQAFQLFLEAATKYDQ